MDRKQILAAGIFLAIVLMSATGCSPTGWTAKTMEDGSSLRPGDQVSIISTNGEIVNGEFTGTEMLSADEYKTLYASETMRPVNGKYLPVIGQSVQITTAISDTRAWIGQLVGFDGINLLMKQSGSAEVDKIYFSSLTSLSDYDGKPIRRMELRSLLEKGAIPLMKALAVKDGDGTVLVPISAVREVSVGGGGRVTAEGHAVILSGSSLRAALLR